VNGKQDVVVGLLRSRREIADAFGALTGYALTAQAVVASIVVIIMVAGLAALEALRARYPRRLNIGRSLLLFWCLGMILLVLAGRNGIVSSFLVDVIIRATGWIAATAIVLATVYLFWSGLAERTLSVRLACGALVISAAFAAAWIGVLHVAGVQLSGMPATNVIWILSPLLLPLTASALAPWSLSRVRHV
jgi:hypothetical protein